MKTLMAWVWLVLFLLPGCYMLNRSGDYYGLDTASHHVVFVLDVSGSMEGKDEGTIQDQVKSAATQRGSRVVTSQVGGEVGQLLGQQMQREATKLGSAKRELIPAIKGLAPDARFTLLAFGNDVQAWEPDLVEASASNKTRVQVYVQRLSAEGATPAKAALEKAFAFPEADVIFFVTDGLPTDAPPDEILAQLRVLNAHRDATIHTIGLGDNQDEQFLQTLAEEHHGTYVKK